MGSLVSAVTGSSKKAARAQVRAAEDANNDLGRARDQILTSLQPNIDLGENALQQLGMYTGTGGDSSNPLYGSLLKPFTGADLENTPGYQFGLNQGQLALQRQQAATGSQLSGAAMKAAERYGQDYAGTQFQNAYNRDALDKARINDFLGNLGNVGVNALNNANNTRYNASVQYGNNTMGAGNATAAGIVGNANAWDNVLNTGVTAAMMAAGGMGGLGAAGAGAATTGGMASTGAMRGFSQNLLNPNFASNYMPLAF